MLFAVKNNLLKSQETGSSHFNLIFLKLFAIYQSEQNKAHGCNMSTWCYIIYVSML